MEARSPRTRLSDSNSNDLHFGEALACTVEYQVPVVLLDHGERGTDDLGDLEGTDAIQQGLSNEAVSEGVEAGFRGQTCCGGSSLDEFVPVAVAPRLTVVADQEVGARQLGSGQAME